jgi:hypothetical protein
MAVPRSGTWACPPFRPAIILSVLPLESRSSRTFQAWPSYPRLTDRAQTTSQAAREGTTADAQNTVQNPTPNNFPNDTPPVDRSTCGAGVMSSTASNTALQQRTDHHGIDPDQCTLPSSPKICTAKEEQAVKNSQFCVRFFKALVHLCNRGITRAWGIACSQTSAID